MIQIIDGKVRQILMSSHYVGTNADELLRCATSIGNSRNVN